MKWCMQWDSSMNRAERIGMISSLFYGITSNLACRVRLYFNWNLLTHSFQVSSRSMVNRRFNRSVPSTITPRSCTTATRLSRGMGSQLSFPRRKLWVLRRFIRFHSSYLFILSYFIIIIVRIVFQAAIGQRSGFSKVDAYKINTLYGCKACEWPPSDLSFTIDTKPDAPLSFLHRSANVHCPFGRRTGQ